MAALHKSQFSKYPAGSAKTALSLSPLAFAPEQAHSVSTSRLQAIMVRLHLV